MATRRFLRGLLLLTAVCALMPAGMASAGDPRCERKPNLPQCQGEEGGGGRENPRCTRAQEQVQHAAEAQAKAAAKAAQAQAKVSEAKGRKAKRRARKRARKAANAAKAAAAAVTAAQRRAERFCG